MTLRHLIADLRKISRRLRRRGHLVSAYQLRVWQRRAARLRARLQELTGRQLRKPALALGAVALSLGLSQPAAAALRFTDVPEPGIMPPLIATYYEWANYQQPTFADMDGDGDLDAIATSDYGQPMWFVNEGSRTNPNWVDKTGSTSPLYNFYWSYSYKGITTGDVDGDGDLDIVVGANNYLYFLENTGTRTAPAFTGRYYNANPFYDWNYNYGNWDPKPVLADLDGDGDLDLTISLYDYAVFLKNTGTRTAPTFAYQSGSANPFNGLQFSSLDYMWLSLGDLDGDGDLDAVVGGYGDYKARLWKNTGTATSPAFTDDSYLPLQHTYFSHELVDYDGDGDLDIITGSWSSNYGFWKFENVGSPTAANFTDPVPYYNLWNSPVRADIDSDGDQDIMQYGYLWVNDHGAFHYDTTRKMQFVYDMWNGGVAVGDFDGDGDNDLISNNSWRFLRKEGGPGVLQFTELTGPGTPLYSVSPSYSNSYDELRAVDMDGDGDLDIVVATYTSGNTSIRYLRNDGTATAPVFSVQTGANNPFNGIIVSRYSRPLIEDLDRDGDIDLLSFSYYAGESKFWRNDGSTTAPSLVDAGDPMPDRLMDGSPLFYDFDKDGDTDAVIWDWTQSYRFRLIRNDSDLFGKTDPVAKDKDQPVAGPVPVVSGQEICVYLPSPTSELSIELYNLAGEKVSSGFSGTGGNSTCMRASVAPGLYWARIKMNGKTTTQKIVVTQ